MLTSASRLESRALSPETWDLRSSSPSIVAVMSRYLFALLLLLTMLPVVQAQNFRVLLDNSDMVPNVEVSATSIANVVAARLVNHEDFDVQCSVRFDTGPDQRTRRVRVKAGQAAVASYSVSRPGTTQKVRVHTVCDIAEASYE